MIPSIGRIVHYTLADYDVVAINAQRAGDPFKGNAVTAGDVYPMLITRVWASPETVTEGTAVQGQVFLDGPDTLWVTSRQQGDQPGQWHAPIIVTPPAVSAPTTSTTGIAVNIPPVQTSVVGSEPAPQTAPDAPGTDPVTSPAVADQPSTEPQDTAPPAVAEPDPNAPAPELAQGPTDPTAPADPAVPEQPTADPNPGEPSVG